MLYHIHAATPPAASSPSKKILSKYFTGLALSGLTPRLDDSSLVFFQQAFRLPTRQPLVDHFHWYSDLLLHAVRKPFRFFGHFATRAIQPQGQPHHNLLHAVLADQLAQTAHILVAIDARQHCQRLRQPRACIRDRQADACAAIIHREDARFSTGFVDPLRLRV